jgi:hypothetical protein
MIKSPGKRQRCARKRLARDNRVRNLSFLMVHLLDFGLADSHARFIAFTPDVDAVLMSVVRSFASDAALQEGRLLPR